jgi:hypothetical protein
METRDITDILSVIDTAAEKLCAIDPVWDAALQ